MGWAASPAKRREWSERLKRHERSGVTVGAFCAKEGVSLASFYSWRRKLRSRAEDRQGIVQTGSAAPAAPAPSFVPLRIAAAGTPESAVRLRLPNGVQLWLPAGDARLLAAAIAAAGRLGSSHRKDEFSSEGDDAC